MKQKSETTKSIKDFVAEIEPEHHKTPMAFQTDNGGKYVTNDWRWGFGSKVIIHEFSPPCSPENIGMAERLNRTIGVSPLGAMLESTSTYDKRLWPEAVLTSAYIKNLTTSFGTNGSNSL